jgi:hypothetical protein
MRPDRCAAILASFNRHALDRITPVHGGSEPVPQQSESRATPGGGMAEAISPGQARESRRSTGNSTPRESAAYSAGGSPPLRGSIPTTSGCVVRFGSWLRPCCGSSRSSRMGFGITRADDAVPPRRPRDCVLTRKVDEASPGAVRRATPAVRRIYGSIRSCSSSGKDSSTSIHDLYLTA